MYIVLPFAFLVFALSKLFQNLMPDSLLAEGKIKSKIVVMAIGHLVFIGSFDLDNIPFFMS